MLDGDNLIAKKTLIWIKLSDCGVIIPQKLGYCSKCTRNSLCNKLERLLNQTKKFPANLNEVKQQTPNLFGHLIARYVGELEEYLRRFSNIT